MRQKRNQPAIEKWPFGFAFGAQLGLRQTQALIKTKEHKKTCKKNKSSSSFSSYETVRHGPVCAALFFGMSNRVEHQKLNQVGAGRPPPAWVFGVQLGLRQTRALIKTKTIIRGKVPPAILLLCKKHYYFIVKLEHSSNMASGTFPLLIVLVLTSACVCRRPSWTPKTQPGGGRPAPTWLSFWCSTRLLMPKKSAAQTGSCRTVSYILLRFKSVPVSTRDRVEHQKRNQTATSQWPVGFVFGVQLDYSCRERSRPPDAEKGVLAQMVNFVMTSFVDSL